MSFNRGFRGGDNRMNNQRPMQRMSNISPWACGVVPSARPSSSQSLLSLPTSQLQQNATTNLLSAQQLALASSLLTSFAANVLPNQQQQQQQISQQLQLQQAQQRNDNLPALLRMGRSPIGVMGNSQPSFRQQGQRNDKFNNTPGDRFRTMDTMRNRMQYNMSNNRVEPYSKNRAQQSPMHQQQQQRRSFVNKPRGDRKPTASLNKPAGSSPEVTGQKSKFRKPVTVAEPTNSGPKEQEVESKTVDEPVKEVQIVPSDGVLAKSTNRDAEEEEIKRDWKDEKNVTSIETVVDPLPLDGEVKESDNNTVVASEEPIVKDDDKEAKEKILVLQCHICNVSVDSIKLLEEHTKLESHKALMEKTSASYQAQAAALRLNMQEAYDRNESMNRNNRHDVRREYCKMCKLNFVGSIASHRKFKAHLQLKTFLHPRCLSCSKEFTTRIDWDAHKLTAAHQLQEQALLAKSAAKAAAGLGHPKKKTTVVEQKGYQPNKIYGYHYVSEGFFCRICEKFFDKRPLSRAHLQSKEHYDLCIAFETKEKEKLEISDVSDVKVVPSADLEAVNVESVPVTDNSITEPSDTVESESEGSECKRQKLSEDANNETSVATSEEDQKLCPKIESGDTTEGENTPALVEKTEELEGEGASGVSSFSLDDDINMILDESGLDLLTSNDEDAKDEAAKPNVRPRRGGRAARGRKRK